MTIDFHPPFLFTIRSYYKPDYDFMSYNQRNSFAHPDRETASGWFMEIVQAGRGMRRARKTLLRVLSVCMGNRFFPELRKQHPEETGKLFAYSSNNEPAIISMMVGGAACRGRVKTSKESSSSMLSCTFGRRLRNSVCFLVLLYGRLPREISWQQWQEGIQAS